MANTDIDKILEDLKKRREQSPKAESTDVAKEPEMPEPKTEVPAPKEEHILTDEGKKAISNFINSDDDAQPVFATNEASKKSDEYIDDDFKKFFTQSVIVTKAPEETNVDVKRKKGGFFRKKYITDSLTLKVPEIEKETEKAEKAVTRVVEQPKEEINKPVKQPETQSPIASITSTDADDIARQILQRRRRERTAIPKVEEDTIENIPVVKETTPQGNDIISSIYSSVVDNTDTGELLDNTTFIQLEEADDIQSEKPQNEEITIQADTAIPVVDEEQTEEVFEEYISSGEFVDKIDEESRDITSELQEFRQTLNFRILLGMASGVILTYFTLAAQNGFAMPEFISPQAQPLIFYIASTVIFAITFIGFLPTITAGFKANKKSPAPDAFVSLSAVMAFIQLIVFIINSAVSGITDVTIFAPFVCFLLAFNAIGKRINIDTILKNLTLANVPDGINAGYIIEDEDAVKRLARSLDEKVPKILVSRKTDSIKNFVKAGFSIHSRDYTAYKVALASYAVVLLCFVLGRLKSGDFGNAFFCAAGAAVFMAPLSHTLVNSVPDALMQKNLEKVGALVNGWLGMDTLSKTTHVNFDAKHLFPEGTVTLQGIKTFEKERLDLAIIYAASVLIKECDTLRPVFMDVIEGKPDILPEVSSCEYYECQGYVAWVDNNRVIIGNRALMNKYEIDMPPESLEARFNTDGRKPVYLAVGGRLFGMFVFSYTQDKIVKDNLEKLVSRGVSIILSSNDFNIDSNLIEQVYGISGDFINVLNQKESDLLSQFTEYAPETEACIAHLDSLSSLVAGFCSAEATQSAEKVCNLIQILSVFLGGALAVMFTYSQTIQYISIISLFLISFAWMALSTISAFARKY